MAYEYSLPTPTNVTPFSQVLPYERVFNPQLINQLAMDQLSPDINRQQGQSMNDLGRQMVMSGAYRTGQAPVMAQKVLDGFSRMLKEQTSQFSGQVNNWMTDWYNRQSEGYYKNPSRYQLPTLPTYDQYLKNNPQYQQPTGSTNPALKKQPTATTQPYMANMGTVAPTPNIGGMSNPISSAYGNLNTNLSSLLSANKVY